MSRCDLVEVEDARDAGTDSAGTTTLRRPADVEPRPAPPLRDSGHLVGVAISTRRLDGAAYARTAAREFNYVTPENEMKWNTIEPQPGSFSFGDADRVVRFARDNDMLVKGHTLVWHSQLPDWVEALEGADTVRDAMRSHIDVTVGHFREQFPGSVVAWDVVNEAFDVRNGSAFYRESVFYRELGEGFIGEAFHRAREADPSALLYYNDFGVENLGAKSQATYEMVRDLVEGGVPIDGIGFQMHTSGFDSGPSRAEFEENLQRYVDLGLLVSISEMDVYLCSGFSDPAAAFEAQRRRYHEIVGTCLQFPECDSVTFWGVGDDDSWLNWWRPCEVDMFSAWPLLFDATYAPKPAWHGVYDALIGCRSW